MFCTQCGNNLPPGSRFCGKCGTPQEVGVSAAAAPAFAPQRYSPPVYAPPPAYAQAWGAQPQPAYAPTQPGTGPVPPAMHWVVVLILTWVTGGIFGLVWCFKQAGFVKKIDPASKAKLMLAVGLVTVIAEIVLLLMAALSGSQAALVIVAAIFMLLNLVVTVVWLVAVFQMRASLVRYYNTVERINLQLSGVMTFFFNLLYFQYHFTRIAEWKRTGRLS